MPQPPGVPLRADLQHVADMIEPDSRVLDVGCGDGTLLHYLYRNKRVDGRGLELSSDGVNSCVSAGLAVIQGDADTDLNAYPDEAFDYVVLSQTLQATREPRMVLKNLVRIGRRAIVSIPNFGYWRIRAYVALRGRMPVNNLLPYQWYETPNIHLCTLKDFVILCRNMGITIERSIALDNQGRARRFALNLLVNLGGELGVFMLCRNRRA
jgi:methionine biosynthesis protein MetW